MNEIIPKRCLACKRDYPPTPQFFHRNKRQSDGLYYYCKECASQQHKEYYQANHSVLLAKSNQYGKTHRKERNAYQRQRAHGNVEVREYWKVYRVKNRERLSAMHRANRKKEHVKAKRRVEVRNRRAHNKGIPGKHTAQQIRDLYLRQRKKCYYCRIPIRWGCHHVDHTFPSARWNGIDPINSIEYLVITCPTCNMRKGDLYPWEFPEGNRLF